jgi:biotin-dependent carboxylase-like uncharacterized protein
VSLVVVRRGVFATVQDLGRPGYRAWGVPVGGAFDVRAHELANALVGNGPEAATLELTLAGGAFQAECDLALAVAGAPMPAKITRGAEIHDLRGPCSFTIRGGERLDLGGAESGARAYLAVAGGWQTPVVLGSRSSEVPLAVGDRIAAGSGRIAARRPAAAEETKGAMRVLDGPDADCLDPADWEAWTFHVGPESNRMGLRLDGPPLVVRSAADRASAPVLPGAVQVAGGQAIILGVACGTMGGYPHVVQVISADLPRIGQLRPGEAVRFRRVSLNEARAADRDDRRRRTALGSRLSLMAGDPFGRALD